MNVNVVIVGHIDHGKSTLIGRLLYDSGALSNEKLAEIQKLLEEYKRRFEFAAFLDSFEEELREERTIDTTRVLFKGREHYYTIVDVPGHKEFIKNMLTGACHAQTAVLVVSASDGVQEQTGRHAFLVHMLGIKNLLVAVNKMDLVDYNESSFKEIKNETNRLLSSLGYSEVKFIPISAMQGDNVYSPSEMMTWYSGTTLIQALDATKPEQENQRPLRFAVQDTYTIDSDNIIVGRVESSTLIQNKEIIFQPSGVKGKVEKIKIFPSEVREAKVGASVGLMIGNKVERGNVGGYLDFPPVPAVGFLGELVLLNGVLREGDELWLKCGTGKTRCRVKEIKERISSDTGKAIEGNMMEIRENEAAVASFDIEPLVVEKFSDIPEMGRFILTKEEENVGAGVILQIEKSSSF